MIQEHANGERRISQGGYGDRQIFELVQNGADELRDHKFGEIQVVLTPTHLYCANGGNPVTANGADSILRMSVSKKRGGQIGRFGVGVKSVLAICDAPQFFSHDGAIEFGFGFDKEWARTAIRAVHPGAEETPTLRMAQVLDVDACSRRDPILASLLEWAVTVVRLPLKRGKVERLARDLASFPAEFLLFSPHVGMVTLEDRSKGRPSIRRISQRVDKLDHYLEEEGPTAVPTLQRWRVFRTTHAPTSEAMRAAGELHNRDTVELAWAVPERSGARGMFWSYFPTKFGTTLRGILNAPWKTSEDRQAIFDGNAFNEELLLVAAKLVVDSLPLLSAVDDPGLYIDFLPGRGREAPQFADERLTHEIWKAAAAAPSLVDQVGRFSLPTDLRLSPENLDQDLIRLWTSYQGRPRNWIHASTESRERRARVNLIMSLARKQAATVRDWIEALVRDGSPEASATAILLVAKMVQSGSPLAHEAMSARFILTRDHGMVKPVTGAVFRRQEVADALDESLVYVADDVLSTFGVVSALDDLGVREADARGRFQAVVDKGFATYSNPEWEAFWQLARAAGAQHVIDVLTKTNGALAASIKVRTLSGTFRPLAACLLPGAVVPSDGTRDGHVCIDLTFHNAERDILVGLGALEGPAARYDVQTERWFDEYREFAWKHFVNTLGEHDGRPQVATIRVDGPPHAGPLQFLKDLSPEGTAAFLAHLPASGLSSAWTRQVGRQTSTQARLPSPLKWMARRHGHLRSSLGVRRVPECVSPMLREYAAVLPVAEIPVQIATALGLPDDLAKVPQKIWHSVLARVTTSEDDDYTGRAYALVLRSGAAWPEGLATRCRVGDSWSTEVDDADIVVAEDRVTFESLVAERIPALLAPDAESASLMVSTWGMKVPEDVIQREIRFVAAAQPVPLTDLFPYLRVVRRQVDGVSLIRCSELEEITRTPNGIKTRELRFQVQGHVILVARPDSDIATLGMVDSGLRLGLGQAGCESVMDHRRRQLESERKQSVRQASSEIDKILALIGDKALRAGLPSGLLETEERRTGKAPDARRIAQLAMDSYGESILSHYGKDVARRNDDAPRAFNGAASSRRFVADLGLPDTYAGVDAPAVPEREEVQGPSEYPGLHQYQDRLAASMVALLAHHVPGRAMLQLPTGAGKTRVAVEAVIRFARTGGLQGPVLWIAQSEELCEQAVQSWMFVWSKVGPPETLTISRFWSGHDATPVAENSHLVVATDAQLEQRLARPEYTWLREPSVVIVDEAHRGISPRYTQILETLGLTAQQTARPLVGLSATPYRTNDAEAHRLAQRFGGRRLNEGLFGEEDPYTALQKLGVLAKVDHREIAGGTLTLTSAEQAAADKYGNLPPSAEQQLANDPARNEALIREIQGLDPSWPVLVFATSVEHAKLLAALLNGQGIRSGFIDSYTPLAQRRQRIDAYRKGRIRVMTNYGVLAQGFDAPATRAVVIARPTFSPIVYQQMIGRGLRGPENGGKETCLILDVHDNIVNYGEDLAFTRFDHLWQADE